MSELIPAAKIKPSGSKLATGNPGKCMRPKQTGCLKSHNRIVWSKDPDKNLSSTGDMHNVTTLKCN